MNSKKLLDALKHIPFQFLFLCLSGLIAILAMMIPEYIVKGIMWFKGDLNAPLGVGNVIVTVIGTVAAMIAVYALSQKAGDDAAILAFQLEKDDLKLNIILPMIVNIGALIIYTAVAFVVGFDYIAGAVKSLAPLLAGTRTSDLFTSIPIMTRFIAFLIVTVPQVPMMFIGYIKAYNGRLKSIGAIK